MRSYLLKEEKRRMTLRRLRLITLLAGLSCRRSRNGLQAFVYSNRITYFLRCCQLHNGASECSKHTEALAHNTRTKCLPSAKSNTGSRKPHFRCADHHPRVLPSKLPNQESEVMLEPNCTACSTDGLARGRVWNGKITRKDKDASKLSLLDLGCE